MRGMGLLPVVTVFHKQKTRTRIQGKLEALSGMYKKLSGAAYEGYEIHMGRTMLTGEAQVLVKREEEILGVCRGQAAGTYIHGIFDSSETADRSSSNAGREKRPGWRRPRRGQIFGNTRKSNTRLWRKVFVSPWIWRRFTVC